MKNSTLFVSFLLFVSGCAFTPHDVNVVLNQPDAAYLNSVKGTTIRLRVIDEREQNDLGRRGAGIAAAKVEAPDLMPKFTRSVENGFRAKGYTLTANPVEADADLVVALRALKFEESAGFFTVGAEVDATILVEAEKSSENFRNQYRSSDEDRQLAISFGEGIDEQINMVLNEVLMQLFNDQKLDSFLTGK
uniref:Uncharacterized lipoprotein YajG n=1 Tax=Candidatus Kentrum sp. SD TaxID=2126332 RepID=A0A450YSE4_9GAMM|nr:MAG: Uncharacterized lipoprotein YajG [Candidatus Kentron sp. SD]VFK44422.1 MAG: Uncharacterized lipoprotein YajG [Candidatus Kentron sp. SD]